MLVSYSSSDDDTPAATPARRPGRAPKRVTAAGRDGARPANQKRRRGDGPSPIAPPPPPPPPPPLPAAFLDLYAAPVRASVVDDPRMHAGRTRQVRHVIGNWNTHVYFEWFPSTVEMDLLQRLTEAMQRGVGGAECQSDLLHPLYRSELGNPAPLHISLSAPISLRTGQRDDFLREITSRIDNGRATAAVSPFSCRIEGMKWVSNAERTRWFLAAGVRVDGRDGNGNGDQDKGSVLDKMLEISNATARSAGCPELYPGRIREGGDQGNEKGSLEKQAFTSSDPLARLAGGAVVKKAGGGAGSPHKTVLSSRDASPYHISLLWRLDPPTSDASKLQSMGSGGNIFADVPISQEALDCLGRVEEDISIRFEDVKVKIGNKIHSVSLG